MKKKLAMLICLFLCLNGVQAKNDPEMTVMKTRNDTVMSVSDLQQSSPLTICTNKYTCVVVYAEGCDNVCWTVNGATYTDNPMTFDSQVNYVFGGYYTGCGVGFGYGIVFKDPNVPTETAEELWKHQYEPITLEAVGADSADMYSYFWPHSGEITRTVEVTNQGNYQCLISDICATATRTKIVNENVEIDLATCDLESNLNLVTWQTNPAQAQYIDHVIVKRDGMQVGTADYSDGQFTDNIDSGSASRTYTLTAIATDGTECPIVSYPKETIHMSYTLGMNNTIEIGWNTPTGYDLLGYNICEWHEDDGSLTVIDYVGASVTSYTCSQSQFDEGYIVVQGVEADKNAESRLLSNRSLDLVGLGENEATAFRVYPNPAKDRFTIEGTGTLTVTNTLGQTVLIQEIDGKTTIELPQGLYFVKLGGVTRKVVVD